MVVVVVYSVHRTLVLILIAAMIDRMKSVCTSSNRYGMHSHHTVTNNEEEHFLQFAVIHKMYAF